MYKILLSVLVISTLVISTYASHKGYDDHKHSHAQYKYGYKVHDSYHKTNFGHHEDRDGYNTKGQYHVKLPDGRLQTVTYHVGDGYSGYVAHVKYSGGGYDHGH